MMRTLANIDSTIILVLYLIPVLLWGIGFASIGSDIFQLENELDGNISAQQYVPVKHESHEKKEDKYEKMKFEKPKRFSDQMRIAVPDNNNAGSKEVVKDTVVSEPREFEKKEFVPEQKTAYHPPKKSTKQKPSNVEIKEEEPGKELEGEELYKSFNLKKATVNNSNMDVSEKSSEVVGNQIVPGQVAENKRFVVNQDNSIYVRNLESFKIKNGIVVPKNTLMSAFVQKGNNKLNMSINRIEINGVDYKVNIVVADESGNEGLITQDIDEMLKDSESELMDIAGSIGSNASVSLPMGMGSVSIPTRKRDNKIEILFDNRTKLTLKVKP